MHKIPKDFNELIFSSRQLTEKWNSITPLARNEFICQIISTKKEETRKNRIKRTCEELLSGKKRPCCWIGCTHRKDKPMSTSQRFILNKNKKST